MTIIKYSHDIFFYMKEIDKYYFPYVDEIEYILFNGFNLKEHVVYTDLISCSHYRCVNGNLIELEPNYIFSSGLIDVNLFKKHFLRFLKEKHVVNEYIKIFLSNKKIKDINSMFNDKNFNLNCLFNNTTDKEANNFFENYYDQYELFNRIYWIHIMKIK